MCLKMEFDVVMLNVISAYSPQVGCIREEKEAFFLDLNKTVEKLLKNERIVVGADLNGCVGEKNAWTDMDWEREITKEKQWWIFIREWN